MNYEVEAWNNLDWQTRNLLQKALFIGINLIRLIRLAVPGIDLATAKGIHDYAKEHFETIKLGSGTYLTTNGVEATLRFAMQLKEKGLMILNGRVVMIQPKYEVHMDGSIEQEEELPF